MTEIDRTGELSLFQTAVLALLLGLAVATMVAIVAVVQFALEGQQAVVEGAISSYYSGDHSALTIFRTLFLSSWFWGPWIVTFALVAVLSYRWAQHVFPPYSDERKAELADDPRVREPFKERFIYGDLDPREKVICAECGDVHNAFDIDCPECGSTVILDENSST